MATKWKRDVVTLELKSNILRRAIYNKERIIDLAKEFNIPHNTISTWKKQSDKIFKDASKSSKKRKYIHLSKYKDIELALLYWLKDMRSREIPPPLDGNILIAKAER